MLPTFPLGSRSPEVPRKKRPVPPELTPLWRLERRVRMPSFADAEIAVYSRIVGKVRVLGLRVFLASGVTHLTIDRMWAPASWRRLSQFDIEFCARMRAK